MNRGDASAEAASHTGGTSAGRTGAGGKSSGGARNSGGRASGGTSGGSAVGGASGSGGNGPGGGSGTGGAIADGATSTGGATNTGGRTNTGGARGSADSGPDTGAEGGGPHVPPDPSECNTLNFHARMDASGAPFQVPTGDHYICFTFHYSLNSGAQGLAFYRDIDNTAVIHHFRLYQMASAQIDGSQTECTGSHPDGAIIAGWTVGAGDWLLPANVGMDLGSGDFVLEVHYNNAGAPTTDRSGLHVCNAKTPRPETATVSWLGADIYPVGSGLLVPAGATPQSYKAGSTCTPANQTAPIHILRSWPHMHRAGAQMTSTITRASGVTEVVLDHPFSFEDQRAFDTPTLLNPGDKIRTDCVYDNKTGAPIPWGESISQEECYDFVIAYPARALTMPGNPLHSTACIPPS